MDLQGYKIEPWIAAYGHLQFDLGNSGIPPLDLHHLLKITQVEPDFLTSLSLDYADSHGSMALRTCISSLYTYIKEKDIIVTAGCSEAFSILCYLLLSRGDEIVILSPSFELLSAVPRSLGVKVIELPLLRKGQIVFDSNAIFELITNKTKALVLNSPHNPTGAVLPPELAPLLCEVSERHECFLIFDEVYRQLHWGPNKLKSIPSFIDLCQFNDKVIVLGSLSKVGGIPGLRVGWVASTNKLLIKKIHEFKQFWSYTSSAFVDSLAIIVLQNLERIIRYWRSVIPKNMDYLYEGSFCKWPFEIVPTPDAGCLCFPRLVDLSMSVNLFCKRLAAKESVFLLPGSTFGVPLHVRMNLAREPEKFREAIDRLQATAQNLTRVSKSGQLGEPSELRGL